MSQILEQKEIETQESKIEAKAEHPLLSDILINATEQQIVGRCEKLVNSKGDKGYCALGVAYLYAR